MDAASQPPRRRLAYKIALIASCGVLGVSLSAPQSQAQSLFDVLFGRQSVFAPPPPLYQPGYEYRSVPFRRPREPEFAPRRTEAVDAKPEKYVPPEVMPGPLGQFLRDPTLRRGDVVATSKGLMVYRGAGGSRHTERDFVALSNAVGFAAGNKANLVALERALKRGHSTVHVGQITADNRLAQAEPVVAQDERAAGEKRR